VCRSPSAGNLVQNPGFNTGLGSWTIGAATSWQQNLDVDACPNSGSARLASDVYYGEPSQCFVVNPNQNYYFGLSIYSQISSDYAYCGMHYYHLAGCTSDSSIGDDIYIGPQGLNSTAGWNRYSISAPSPMDANYASIQCASDNNPINIDQVYLNTTDSY
jgi:hypothetical protein